MVVSLDPAISKQAFDDWIKAFEDKYTGLRNATKRSTWRRCQGAGRRTDLKQIDFKVVQGAGSRASPRRPVSARIVG